MTRLREQKPKASLPKQREGEYSNLMGSTADRKFFCAKCTAKTSRVWDTIVGGSRYSFCSGNCLYQWLMQRHVNREFNDAIDFIIKEFKATSIKTLTPEEDRALMQKQNAELREELRIEELKKKYYEKYGVWPT